MNLTNEISETHEVNALLEILLLNSIETYSHSVRVAFLVEKMLDYEKIDGIEAEEIIKGSLLHDIGKIYVPFNLVDNPKKLDDTEYEIVKMHTYMSYLLVRNSFVPAVSDICLKHHEKLDGSGYPKMLGEKEIPPYVQIVTVADIYEALTSYRSYKRRYVHDDAISILKAEAHNGKLNMKYIRILEELRPAEDEAWNNQKLRKGIGR